MDVPWSALSPELRSVYDAVDWADSPIGEPEGWSDTLRGAVDLMANTRFAVTLLWGPQFVLVYNDAYVAMIGDKHPSALGRPAEEVFPEAWAYIGPLLETARSGDATWASDQYIPLQRRGFLEDCYFTFSYSAVRNPRGEVEGVIDIAAETTAQVVLQRRLTLLTSLAVSMVGAEDYAEVASRVGEALRDGSPDLPLVTVRVGWDRDPGDGLPPTPRAVLSEDPVAPVEVFEEDAEGLMAWLPIAPRTGELPIVMAARLSNQLAWDESYRAFVRLVGGAIASAVERVRLGRVERARAQIEHGTVRALQAQLLPTPATMSSPAVAARYVPAVELAELGGDWYDSFTLPDDSLLLVVGDVMGHDVEAAASMAEARNVLRGVAYSMPEVTPARVLHGVDRAVLGGASGVIATAVVAHVRRREDGGLDVTWSSAGHPPPVLVDLDGDVELLDRSGDLLLGVDDRSERHDHHLDMPAGTTLVLYTDGLVERRAELFDVGLKALADRLVGTHEVDVEELCDDLVGAVASPSDDIALLVLRA